MITIGFDKARAEHFINCLDNGLPIQPPAGRRWTIPDVLGLAGACYFAAMNEVSGTLRPDTPTSADLHAAVEVISRLTTMVKDGDYDRKYHPTYEAIVEMQGGRSRIIQEKGVRA